MIRKRLGAGELGIIVTLAVPLVASAAIGWGIGSLNDLPLELKTILSSFASAGVQWLRLGMTNQRKHGKALLPGDGFQIALAGAGSFVAISVLHTQVWFELAALELQLSAGMTVGWVGAEAGFALGRKAFMIGANDAK